MDTCCSPFLSECFYLLIRCRIHAEYSRRQKRERKLTRLNSKVLKGFSIFYMIKEISVRFCCFYIYTMFKMPNKHNIVSTVKRILPDGIWKASVVYLVFFLFVYMESQCFVSKSNQIITNIFQKYFFPFVSYFCCLHSLNFL